jgi:hypothetical protein
MKQIAFKGRLLLRKILTALSLGAVALTFQACYGMPPPDVSITGTVKSADRHEPIPGIKVSGYDEYNSTLTNRFGNYRLSVGEFQQTVLFKDIDGPENGWFEDKVVEWRPNSGPLNVVLVRKE